MILEKGYRTAAATDSSLLQLLQKEIGKVLVGQTILIDRVLVALLADGHVLLEGVPGLAKTLLVKTIAQAIRADFARIQFTPDLLPADLTGTQIYNPHLHHFAVHKGPIFANLVLADEINRAPAKVQSALLEAMQERQVTIGEATYPLGDLFMVLATQNPIEQEGTYPLPEAQVDRFLFKLVVDYPDRAEEEAIVRRMTADSLPQVTPVLTPEDILQLRAAVRQVYVDDRILSYAVELVRCTRPGVDGAVVAQSRERPQQSLGRGQEAGHSKERGQESGRSNHVARSGDRPQQWLGDRPQQSGVARSGDRPQQGPQQLLIPYIAYGASPRASIYLVTAARATAFLQGRSFVLPEDVKAIAADVLRHRLITTYEADAEGVTAESLIEELLANVPVP